MWSLPTWAAQEGNEGLYEMAAPPDSAFVRVVNSTSGQLELAMDEWRRRWRRGGRETISIGQVAMRSFR